MKQTESIEYHGVVCSQWQVFPPEPRCSPAAHSSRKSSKTNPADAAHD